MLVSCPPNHRGSAASARRCKAQRLAGHHSLQVQGMRRIPPELHNESLGLCLKACSLHQSVCLQRLKSLGNSCSWSLCWWMHCAGCRYGRQAEGRCDQPCTATCMPQPSQHTQALRSRCRLPGGDAAAQAWPAPLSVKHRPPRVEQEAVAQVSAMASKHAMQGLAVPSTAWLTAGIHAHAHVCMGVVR